jgi:Tol biopolymer transport system component
VFVRSVATTSDATAEAESTAEPISTENLPQVFIAQIGAGNALTNVRQLTQSLATEIVHPTLSADGTRVVYASNEDGDFDLFSVDVESREVTRLTDNQALDTHPSFHPTDSNIVLYVSDANSPGFTDIYALSLDDPENPVRIYDDPASAFMPVYSPDASRIAFISTENVDTDLFVINATGDRRFQLTIDDGSAEDRAPAWSPDGVYIAFASNRSGIFQWYAVNQQGGPVSRMITNESIAERISFFP